MPSSAPAPRIKRALISVSNKEGLIEFASKLAHLGVEILSTGGTSKLLAEANICHQKVEEVTGLPEMFGGRVKTLHPKIHGGILGRRDRDNLDIQKYDVPWIDLVVVNFYPFEQVTKDKNLSNQEAIEYIDIGGPTMVRAAAKNHAWVGVIVDPQDYDSIITEIKAAGGLTQGTRENLATKAFTLTGKYDTAIQHYFQNRLRKANDTTEHMQLTLDKHSDLRYGENSHQKALAYQFSHIKRGVLAAQVLQGKPLSFNNIIDAEAGWQCVNEFESPACIIIKHTNPCGAACAPTILDAYKKAYAADRVSAFGGIVALNQNCDKETATEISSVFTEVVLAPRQFLPSHYLSQLKLH